MEVRRQFQLALRCSDLPDQNGLEKKVVSGEGGDGDEGDDADYTDESTFDFLTRVGT